MARREKTALPGAYADRLQRGDRPVVAAELADGGWAVVTVGALVALDPDSVRLRLPWGLVDSATWDAEENAVRIVAFDVTEPITLRLMVDHAAAFPAALRERVESSVVHVETLRLSAETSVRAAIRRRADGVLYSQVSVTGPLRETDAERAAIARLERDAREAVGLRG